MAISSFSRSGLSRVVANGPAKISGSPTGTYSDSGKNYAYFEFTGNGSLTVTEAGLVDMLIVSGGGGGRVNYFEGSGSWLNGSYELSATTHTVTVGAGGVGGSGTISQIGTASSVGSIAARYGGAAPGVAGSNGGITSTITGSSVGYSYHAQASPRTNRGDGGNSTGSIGGSSGIVIVRVEV